jgi:hypothetical protein
LDSSKSLAIGKQTKSGSYAAFTKKLENKNLVKVKH